MKTTTVKMLKTWSGLQPGQVAECPNEILEDLEREGAVIRLRPPVQKIKPVTGRTSVTKGG